MRLNSFSNWKKKGKYNAERMCSKESDWNRELILKWYKQSPPRAC